MKKVLLFLIVCSMALRLDAQDDQKIKGDYFLVRGALTRVDFPNKNVEVAPYTQVVVYQDDDLYVTFFADESGGYSFYLPISKTYSLQFGGSAYINKKIQIDATQLSKERRPRELQLNVELFREIDGVEFPMMAEFWQVFKYSPEADELVNDNVYANRKRLELEKLAKKLRKIKSKEKVSDKS